MENKNVPNVKRRVVFGRTRNVSPPVTELMMLPIARLTLTKLSDMRRVFLPGALLLIQTLERFARRWTRLANLPDCVLAVFAWSIGLWR